MDFFNMPHTMLPNEDNRVPAGSQWPAIGRVGRRCRGLGRLLEVGERDYAASLTGRSMDRGRVLEVTILARGRVGKFCAHQFEKDVRGSLAINSQAKGGVSLILSGFFNE